MTVDTDISSSEDLFGKTISDLQENITVSGTAISGTLKYVTGYTGFSSKTDEQSGNYLAIHCTVPDTTGATITVEVVGGTSGPSTLDADGIIVDKIANSNQKIRVVASKEGFASVTKTFTLTGLTLQSA